MRPLAALILSLAACASAPARAEEPLQPRPTDEAERLSLVGDLPGARAEAERLLGREPANGPALFLAACVALRQGDLGAADALARRLARLDPVPDEAPVLTALVSRRRARPNEPTGEAALAAWREVGSPRPKEPGRHLLPAMWERAWRYGDLFGIDREALARLPPGEAWLLERASSWPGLMPFLPESERTRALEQNAAGNGVLVNLVLLAGFARDRAGLLRALLAADKRAEATAGPDRQRAAQALLRIGRRLGESPLLLDNMVGSRLEDWAAKALQDEQATTRAQEARRRLNEELGRERMPSDWSWPLDDFDAPPRPPPLTSATP